MPREYEEELRPPVFSRCFSLFLRPLTGEPPVVVDLTRDTLKARVDLERAKGKLRVYPLEKCPQLKDKFARLCEARMTFASPQAVCTSVVMVFSKGPV